MIYANEKEIKRCQTLVREMVKIREIKLNDEIIKMVTSDIMNITYATGGDYSDSTLTSYVKTYIDKKMYKKFFN
ncbi:hypothetical protein [Robertmurraya sp. Marseille-Q9965]